NQRRLFRAAPWRIPWTAGAVDTSATQTRRAPPDAAARLGESDFSRPPTAAFATFTANAKLLSRRDLHVNRSGRLAVPRQKSRRFGAPRTPFNQSPNAQCGSRRPSTRSDGVR